MGFVYFHSSTLPYLYCFCRVRLPTCAGSTMPVSLSHNTMPPGATHFSTAGRIFSSVPPRKGGSSSTRSNCSRQLRITMLTASRLSSRKTHRAAPRLSASMPSWPLPAYRSSTRAPGRSNCTMLNIASFTCERVGRVTSVPGSASSLRPRASPAITRMMLPPCRSCRPRGSQFELFRILYYLPTA